MSAFAAPSAVTKIRFTLVELAGVAFGKLELVLRDRGCEIVVDGLLIDVLALARNDPGALHVGRVASGYFGAASEALAPFLLAQLRPLVRGRVVPLEAEIDVEPPAD